MKKALLSFFNPIIRFLRMIISKVSKAFDAVVYNRRASFIVSAIISLLICVSLYSGEIRLELFQSGQVTQSFGNIPVEVQIDTNLYEVSGMPDTVAVSITGPQAEVQVFRNQNNLAVVADLRGYSEGSNEIVLSASNVPSPLVATLDPDTVMVTIERKVTRSFMVSPDILLGSGQSDGMFTVTQLNPGSVMISGTQRRIDSIRSVKAIIDASGRDSDFEAEATVVAYDSTGKQVIGITINPMTVQATVKVAGPDSQEGNTTTGTEGSTPETE